MTPVAPAPVPAPGAIAFDVQIEVIKGQIVLVPGVYSTDTIAVLKDKTSRLTMIPPHETSLIYAGRRLDEYKTVRECNIERESRIVLKRDTSVTGTGVPTKTGGPLVAPAPMHMSHHPAVAPVGLPAPVTVPVGAHYPAHASAVPHPASPQHYPYAQYPPGHPAAPVHASHVPPTWPSAPAPIAPVVAPVATGGGDDLAIFIKMLNGKVLTVEVRPEITILGLKQRIHAKEVPRHQHHSSCSSLLNPFLDW